MKIKHQMREGTIENCVSELIARLRPTKDTGAVLEQRVNELKHFVISKFGEFGEPLVAEWPKEKSAVCSIIPISLHDITKIDAVIDIRVGLYDDLQYPNKLAN